MTQDHLCVRPPEILFRVLGYIMDFGRQRQSNKSYVTRLAEVVPVDYR